MDTKKEIVAVLDEVLCLKGHVASFTAQTPLIGAIPELDSMAVLALLATLEERFGISIGDDEVDGSTFATLGSLIGYIDGKLSN